MGTPKSSEVNAGDTALASQYNDLRKDAVTEGNYNYNPKITRYYTISPSDLITTVEDAGYILNGLEIMSDTINTVNFKCGLHFPNKAILKKMTVYYYRDDYEAFVTNAYLKAYVLSNQTLITIAEVICDNGGGYTSSYNDITSSENNINNSARQYFFEIGLDPNDSGTDVRFCGAVIEYEIYEPFP